MNSRLTDSQIEMLAWLQRAGPMPRAYLAGPSLERAVKAAERRDALSLGVSQARALLGLLRGGRGGV